MNLARKLLLVLCWCTMFVPGPGGTTLFAQLDNAEANRQNPSSLPEATTLPHTSDWRFGMRIAASSDTTGIQATVPVPIEWPEQTVEFLSWDKPDFVTVARIKKNGRDASQLYFKVGQLPAGEEVTVTVNVRITKLESRVPENTDRFVFAKTISSSLRNHLTPSPFIESRDPKIRELAESLPIDDAAPAWNQVEAIYDWVREHVEYRFDPQIRSCLTALETGQGDCEELAGLFIALCRARGIPARAVWIPDHTYPEFYLVDENGAGHWIPCQAAGSRAFGYMPEAKPILQKGDKFRIPGQREPQRYNQPTLKARNAASDPLINWIMEQVRN